MNCCPPATRVEEEIPPELTPEEVAFFDRALVDMAILSPEEVRRSRGLEVGE